MVARSFRKGLIPRADGTKKKSPKYEDAPANATGTAVAGTGDDSSTVVVKKKKDKDKKMIWTKLMFKNDDFYFFFSLLFFFSTN